MASAKTLPTNPGATVCPSIINLLHSAGAGDCDDLLAAYEKVSVTGAGDAGLTIVGNAPRAYVGLTGGANNSVASAAYASQPWAKHEGTGAITAMSAVSAKLDVSADNFTVNTINAGHFHIEGAATVTGQFDGVMIEVYPDVTSLDSLLALAVDTGAVTSSIIRVSGESTTFIDVAAATAAVVVAAGTTIHHDPNAVTSDAYMVVKIGAIEYAMPLYVLHA
jgi:archaellum component FlaF (FlaF/FlaG flagellin family)